LLSDHDKLIEEAVPEASVSDFDYERFGTLSVTQNLRTALPYLRLRDRPRMLWIDAICVNQDDLEERSQQVQLMAEVFKLAERVVVWLGEATPTSACAMGILEKVDADFEFNFITYSAKSKLSSTQADVSSRPSWL
jgi:hypothetical protein